MSKVTKFSSEERAEYDLLKRITVEREHRKAGCVRDFVCADDEMLCVWSRQLLRKLKRVFTVSELREKLLNNASI